MSDPLLIDGDITLYRAAAACEHEVRWDDVNHVLMSNSEEVWSAVLAQIASYKQALGNGPMHFALSGSNNFRRKLYAPYKAGRSRKPLCYGRVRDRLIDEFGAREVEGLEGDDLLGIWATQGRIKDPIIISLDKDLKTIPGRVWRHGVNREQADTMTTVSEIDADYYWMMQTLTGDSTDGYPGLPGCGPKTAEKVLAAVWNGTNAPDPSADVLWSTVTKAYEAKGLSEDDALLQARLARILRASDWNSQTKEVKLWEPSR